MQFSEDDIAKFQKIWKNEFKEEISVDRASHEISLLVEIYTVLAEPLPNEKKDEVETKVSEPQKVRFTGSSPHPARQQVVDIVKPKRPTR